MISAPRTNNLGAWHQFSRRTAHALSAHSTFGLGKLHLGSRRIALLVSVNCTYDFGAWHRSTRMVYTIAAHGSYALVPDPCSSPAHLRHLDGAEPLPRGVHAHLAGAQAGGYLPTVRPHGACWCPCVHEGRGAIGACMRCIHTRSLRLLRQMWVSRSPSRHCRCARRPIATPQACACVRVCT